jgi:NTE family protein
VRIPKSFWASPDKPYHILCIEKSAELGQTLDYESKIDRSAAHIEHLVIEGENCARALACFSSVRASAAASRR